MKAESKTTHAEPTDLELVVRAREGDQEAFRRLVERHQDQIFRVAMRMAPTREDALDICQEAFFKAHRGLAGFKEDSMFSTWLHRIVMNACASFHRQRKAAKRGSAISLSSGARGADGEMHGIDIAAEARGPAEQVEAAEVKQQVAEAVSGLGDEFREVIVMRDLEGLSYQEIAVELGLAPGTVRSRLHRARKELAIRLSHLASALGLEATEGAAGDAAAEDGR